MNLIRNSSTVILLRDGSSGLEIFMVQRHIKSDFVGGAYVFPGGVVDPEDEIDENLCVGHTDRSASAVLGIERGGLAYWVAAIRECFEEAGILLVYGPDGKILDFGDPAVEQQYKAYRAALNRGHLSISDIARREGLKFATNQVHYWAHWITPEGQPRRYDTRFFLAVAPTAQSAAHDGWELIDSAWITPHMALNKAEAREWMIIFPTMRNLMLLREFSKAADAEAAARVRRDVTTVQPRMVKDHEGVRILMPGEEGYDEAGRPSVEPATKKP